MSETPSQSAGNLLAWFAGFVDADGMIGIHKQVSKNDPPPRWVPELSVTTTCTKTADFIHSTLRSMDLPVYRLLRKVTKPNWTDRHHLEVRGLKRVFKVIPMIRPYLVTKADEADFVMEFITSRLGAARGSGYSKREMEIIALMSAIKRGRHK